jgi:2-polyprenyl-3-methyl-5-hydroxy-6-metoxy-1,4-benzoquinol methylase
MNTSTLAIDQSRKCPICGGPPSFEFKAKHRMALKCADLACGHIYAAVASPMQGVQKHFDPDAECKKYALRNVGLVEFLGSIDFLKPDSRILDVGAGVGHVSMAVRAAFPNASITCLEADPDAKLWLQKHRFQTIDTLEDCTGKFDAIYMIEVIEHVDDPCAVLTMLSKLLAPKGKLFITTPCGQATSGRIVPAAYDTPEHVHFFTEKSLSRALVSSGFEAPQFRTVRHLYHLRRGPAVVTNSVKDVARVLRAKLLGQHQLVTVVGPRLSGS